MTRRFVLPGWLVTLGSLAVTIFGVLIGVATASWQARSLVSEQTEAIASLRQTLDESVRPTLAEVANHTGRISTHETRLAVIERTCCGPAQSGGVHR